MMRADFTKNVGYGIDFGAIAPSVTSCRSDDSSSCNDTRSFSKTMLNRFSDRNIRIIQGA